MCRRVFYRETFLKFHNEFNHFMNFYFILHNSSVLLIIMSSPGQKKGTCGNIMALFEGHLKCARCRDKGLETIRVSSNVIIQSARPLSQSRFFNLPPPPTEGGRIRRRRFLPPPPPLLWTLHRSVC